MLLIKEFKKEMLSVHEMIGKADSCAAKLVIGQSDSDAKINEYMDEFMAVMENSCITARKVLEKYRPLIPIERDGGKLAVPSEITGTIEVTPDMRVHIKLNTLLPHCKYKTTTYLPDTILRLLNGYPGTLPKYENAFLAIVEHCNHTNRNAYDQDNKGWKQIPNALKGILFDDDDQFHLSIGLFSVYADETACHIYVMSIESASDFMFSMGENRYGFG